MPLPFENFDREKLQQWVNGLVIAFKPDHGVQGQLHRDTCYGYIEKGATKGALFLRLERIYGQLLKVRQKMETRKLMK